MPLLFPHNADYVGVMTDLPRGSAASNTLPPDQPYGVTSSTPTTSLPSFASLKEHSAARNDDVDGPEISSMSSRLSCYFCVKLRPLVKDVADAVAELDESVRAICNPLLNAVSVIATLSHRTTQSLLIDSVLTRSISHLLCLTTVP